MYDVVVIGGGPSGLNCAYRLSQEEGRKRGHANKEREEKRGHANNAHSIFFCDSFAGISDLDLTSV